MNRTVKTTFVCAASALLLTVGAGLGHAGRGATEASLRSAIRSNAVDAIVAELERAENIPCRRECMEMVMELLDHDAYALREAAAWWFARRPAQKAEIAEGALAALAVGTPVEVRNAADALGTFGYAAYLEGLTTAAARADLDTGARVAIARALGRIGNKAANPALASLLADEAPAVRREAVAAWRAMLQQDGAAPLVPLVDDPDVAVRRAAIANVGFFREADARVALEARLAGDDDAAARRNAAWALGRLGDPASRGALEAATDDPSGLVRRTAEVALRQLR